jgi:tol-pal system protein YbgF
MRSILANGPARLPARLLPDKLAVTVTVAVVAALAGCASTRPEDDPVQIKLNDLDGRVGRIERVVSNQSLVELAQNLDAAQADIRRLRGQVEELQNSNEQMKKRLAGAGAGGGANYSGAGGGGPGGSGAYASSTAVNSSGGSGGAGGASANGSGSPGSSATAAGAIGAAGAVDFASATGSGGAGGAAGGAGTGGSSGSAAASGAATAAAGSAASSTGTPPVSSVEQAVYNQAFEALKAGSYSVSITSFKDFLANYPASPLAENAQYWLGEAYYVTRSYDEAGGAFRTVLQKWPASRKAPDAMLKLGFTQFELKRYTDSRKTLEEVTQKYPDSDASRLATERLKRIPANPH